MHRGFVHQAPALEVNDASTNGLAELRPRRLFCVIADAHRSIDAALEVCQGRFTEAGQVVQLAIPPDWIHAALPDDDEWRIAWHKFYYGLDLAHAFVETSDRRFLDTWRELVLSFIDQAAAEREADSHVTSRRVLNWLYAWDRFASDAAFRGIGPHEAERIFASLGQQVARVRAHLTPRRNHRTIELTALLLAVIAFPALDADGALLRFSVAELYKNLCQDVLDDGVHVERSTHYHMICLRNFLAIRVSAAWHGVKLPDGFDDRLLRACTFAMHVHRPDGGIPAFSDADAGGYLDLLALAADLFDRDDFRYAATAGRAGRAPAAGANSPTGGYFIQRSTWGGEREPMESARFLMMDCGPVAEGGVESIDRAIEVKAIARYFSSSEREQLGRCTETARRARFFELWTQKEALLKALGVGLSRSLDSLSFDLEADGAIALSAGVPNGPWQFAVFAPTPRHRLAVAGAEGATIATHCADTEACSAIQRLRTSR